MSTMTVIIAWDGSGTIAIDDVEQPLHASSIGEMHQKAVARAVEHARATGEAVALTVKDPGGLTRMEVGADGTVTRNDGPAAEPAARPAAGSRPETGSRPAPTPQSGPTPRPETASRPEQPGSRPAPAHQAPAAGPERRSAAQPPAPEPDPQPASAPASSPVPRSSGAEPPAPSPRATTSGPATSAPAPSGPTAAVPPAQSPSSPTAGRRPPQITEIPQFGGPASTARAAGPAPGPEPSSAPAPAASSQSAPSPARPEGPVPSGSEPDPSALPEPGPQSWPAASALPAPAPVDPRWEQIRTRPAEEGIRGALHLAPSVAEVQRRRAAYESQLAEEERQRVEREQAAEEAERERIAAKQQSSRTAARRREQEARAKEQRRLIQTNFQGTRTLLVANPKGGSRKTTSTYLLAATMGIVRGGSVIAWDANESMGTLGDRAIPDLHSNTVVDLLERADAAFSSIDTSRLGVLDRFVRPQGDCHFDVLASDDDPTRQDIVDRAGFATVHEILSRFYRLILVDTGNNVRVQHFQAAVDAADLLVIPVAAAADSATVARKMMESLAATGHKDLVDHAVVLLHDLEPLSNDDPEYIETARAVAADFEGDVSAVVPIPFDPALKEGREIDYEALAEPTRQAYMEAAAAIAESLRTLIRNGNQRSHARGSHGADD